MHCMQSHTHTERDRERGRERVVVVVLWKSQSSFGNVFLVFYYILGVSLASSEKFSEEKAGNLWCFQERLRSGTMLRKSSRTIHKDQSQGHLMSDSASDSSFSSVLVQKNRISSFSSVPGVLVGFTAKGLLDYESANSPTSPLDVKAFSNLFPFRSPRSGQPQKRWGCNNNKVGLGIVDSLNDETKPCGPVLGSSNSRNILFGSQMRMNIPSCQALVLKSLDSSLTPRSLPKNYAISPLKSPIPQSGSSDKVPGSHVIKFENEVVGNSRLCLSYSGRSSPLLNSLMYCNPKSKSDDFQLATRNTQQDSGPLPLVTGRTIFEKFSNAKSSSLPVSKGSGHEFIGSLPSSEIELSEDYTCVIAHGPNPRTTHIYGDCILESHSVELADCNKEEEWWIGSPQLLKGSDNSYPPDDFLSFCYTCKKRLDEGKDIYMYRGEKAFCSCSCRSQEILSEEEMENPTNNSSHSPKLACHEQRFGFAIPSAHDQ